MGKNARRRAAEQPGLRRAARVGAGGAPREDASAASCAESRPDSSRCRCDRGYPIADAAPITVLLQDPAVAAAATKLGAQLVRPGHGTAIQNAVDVDDPGRVDVDVLLAVAVAHLTTVGQC